MRYLSDMPCLVGCLALAFPRLALFLVWFLGGNYLARAYDGLLWPLLGFIFLPLTTLTFAFATNSLGQPGAVTPLGWLLTVVALLIDLGLVGHSGSRFRDRHKGEQRVSG
jgi:hypothetical protein